MELLSVKMREGAYPQEKPRVYFCSHVQDHTRFFESLSDEVLRFQNCGVWYLTNANAPVDEEMLFSQLSEMQMFLIPITSAFLYTDNQARLRDMEYAREHHIPMLPIMMEAGLVNDFNRICGNYQFLDKTAVDATAIKYDDKLSLFLKSALVGDEEAARVRQAFDGYIFLSYRKKDRAHAQEVMRLIHENEQYQNIAIWYDEYLVPGEDFNNAIGQALDKSQLFVMVVTPNLVNEPNYVQEYEYPAACRSGKPILAAQAVSTDRRLLEELYPDIPPCAQTQDKMSFNGALLRELRRLALPHRDDPQHRYYTGLAYLAGIDVEKNAARGIQMIRRAAQAGLVDAIEKMVTTYELGDGVAIDWNTALQWREVLVKKRRQLFEKQKTEVCGATYLKALIDLSDAYRKLDEPNKANECCKELVSQARLVRQHYKSRGGLRDLILAQQQYCEILMASGDLVQSEQLLEQTDELVTELMSAEEDEIVWLDYYTMLCCRSMQGRFYEVKRDQNTARLYYTQALQLARDCYEESEWIFFAFQLGELSLRYGKMLVDSDNYVQARRVLGDGVEFLEHSRVEVTLSVLDNLLVSVYLFLAIVEENTPTLMTDYLYRAKDIAEKLYEREPVQGHLRLISQVYSVLGNALAKVNPNEAQAYTRQGRRYMELLVEAHPVLDNCSFMAEYLLTEARGHLRKDDALAAKATLLQVIALLEPFSVAELLYIGGENLLKACSYCAAVALEEGKAGEALSILLKALQLAEDYPAVYADNCYHRADYFQTLAGAYKELGNLKAALHYAYKVFSCYSLMEEDKRPDDYELLANNHNLLGEIFAEKEDYAKAAEYYTQYMEYCEEQADEEDLESMTVYATACSMCGYALYFDDRPAEAIVYLECALAILEDMYAQTELDEITEQIEQVQEILDACYDEEE